ncbi:GntR family transcriptional regulator [Shimia sp. R9_3]|uniref:GntR family transcriptional regulator n=1 Tax=Shimia sp. R9_3 TaxID=2821113 RepID=UPI001AD9B280|nr:GntR family transcriptional regulator [Shimia sp. R9_3]MBO9402853.1 GntR family transcriptional regulator [Shimia sp. R9_3]
MKDATTHKKAKLVQHLKGAILTLKLEPGQDLDEAALSDVFGLSRTPLREVFAQLAGEGFIELRKNRGAWVSAMTHTTLRDFFLAAPMIYGAILKLAARNARSAQIEELRETQDRFKEALRKGAPEDRALANNRFHEVTGDMADNIYLLPSFRRLLIDHARIGMTFYRPQDREMADKLSEASAQHDTIIEAIAARDEDAAERLAVDHWNLSREQIERFVTPRSLDMPLGGAARKTSA